MSYRTNRRTGGVFRTRDYTPSEIESQSRRYICPICEAMFRPDVAPAVAEFQARQSGHETPGTPISSFVSREELREHQKLMHPTQRRPTREHRRVGRGDKVNINITQTNTAPETPMTPESVDQGMLETESPETVTEGETETEGESADEDAQVFEESKDEGGSLL